MSSKKRFTFDPIDAGNINGGLLTIAVIAGLILSFITASVIPLFILPILSQFRLIRYTALKILYPREIEALEDVMISARLYEKPDNFTYRRYLRAVKFKYFENDDFIEVRIFGSGVRNLDKLDTLSKNLASAFNCQCYLIKSDLNSVTYKLDKRKKNGEVNEDEF